MPVDLSSNNTFTFNSRLWGNRPRKLAAFPVETERIWAGKLAAELNKDFALSLSTSLGIFRNALEIGSMAEEMNRLKIVVAGGSNAAKVAAECKGPGITVESIAAPGWRLASNTVSKLVDSIASLEENVVVVLYGIDNICFVLVDEDMRSGPPYRGKDGKFHAHGTLEVVSGVLFDRILALLKDVVSACPGKKLVIVTPMPRFWIPCCEKGRKLDSLENDSDKRRPGMVARLHATDRVEVINPMEAMGVSGDLQAIEQMMNGPAHLISSGYKLLAEAVIKQARRVDRGAEQYRKRFKGGSGSGYGSRSDRFH
jgi:hypothetical protein